MYIVQASCYEQYLQQVVRFYVCMSNQDFVLFFNTSSYKKKMQEMAEEEERQRKQDERDGTFQFILLNHAGV